MRKVTCDLICSTIYNSGGMETTQMSVKRGLDKAALWDTT